MTFLSNNLQNKFSKLSTEKSKSFKTRPNWFSNQTQVVFPPEVSTALALGPKFVFDSVPSKDIPVKTILADVENIINLSPHSSHDFLRAKCTNAITNSVLNRDSSPSFVKTLYHKAFAFLKDHKEILVIPSDKGSVAVALYTQHYKDKMLDLIGDPQVYTKLQNDPTNKFQADNNEMVKLLKTKKWISEDQARKLTTYKALPPRIYGLPKLHKVGIPLRPIVSTINSPTSHLSQFCAHILNSAFSDFHKFAVQDSFIFSSKINNFQLPPNHKVISLDVVSLFTNIPWFLTKTIIETEWTRISNHTSIDKSKFLFILEFLFKSNYFVYDNEFYSQIFGCPMGSTLSPVLASIVMSSLLNSCVDQLSFRLPFLYQYVDDIITAIPLDGSDEVLNVFNNYNEHLQFTIEEETHCSVPFLDTKVIRGTDNVIRLDWYRKPTSSGRYIHVNSGHEWSIKLNLIKGMYRRIKRIAHPDFLTRSQDILTRLFMDNGYSKAFLLKIRNGVNVSVDNPATEPNHLPIPINPGSPTETLSLESDIRPSVVTLPFIPLLTSKLVHIFRTIPNIKIVKYYYFKNKRLFSRLKQPFPPFLQSDVIYSISCSNCQLSYIGQTSQSLKRRIALHRSDTRCYPHRCALATHAVDLGHRFNFEQPKILHTMSNLSKRTFLEMCYINENTNGVNKRSDVAGLSNIYSFLLSFDVVSRRTPSDFLTSELSV